MRSSTVKKATNPPPDKEPGYLSLPVEGQAVDREPHSYERWLITKLLRMTGSPPIAFKLWNNDVVAPETGYPKYTLSVKDPRALFSLVTNPNLAFGDLYSAGRLDVDNNLPDLMAELYRSIHRAREDWPKWLEALWRTPPPRSSSVEDARDNIHHHYDLGNRFYQLWLDRAEMQYTCAYYERPDLTLEQAQLAKLEHVCRKLRLKPGQTVIEAGCGWGGLARYMARHYGVRVQAYNISREQVAYARAEARRQGLEHRIEYIDDDYRNLSGQCDAFVSIGMLEHVGKENYPQLAELIRRSLKPNGLALLHSIGRNRPMLMNTWIEKRIFPGAYPPSLSEFLSICESGNFSVLDVENLRLHYAQTLKHWLERFEQHRDDVTAMYDEHFTRAWRLYLAGSIAAFEVGSLQLFQVLFTRADNHQLPQSRCDIYQSAAAPAND
ncbi:SAM-dependent methyltransferase [Marinobacter zhejiangensis]|uniref:Cyclopropane-fatty-acyl-phospholipid synthase n=1 Tax=Marinobacter zhejiangensis TaxID=488535 RepID=A0A1I4KZN3_9GAMM|nr:cyclopropane-fatty-acyl-phospholipid synthase family protein [Marinobacter zhejiangensis]SFL84224.1 cyclopropane-fatty-acyl-phospholipid synthase [Marinobacter zhejiangensis]